MHQIDCHEEKIHLCGKIQHFGYLLVFDQDARCISYSRNLSDLQDILPGELTGITIDAVLSRLTAHKSLSFEAIDKQISDHIFYRFVENVRIKDNNYNYSIYRNEGHIYLEIEACNQHSIKPTRLYYYAKYLEDKDTDIWQSLTVLIREIVGFDRVMVYHFHEDKSGQVIAESVAADMDSLIGYRYPEFDIPKQARALYVRFLARHTTDTEAPIFELVGQTGYDIDLSRCSIRALSPVHLQYLRNAGVRASASFSIIVNGKLWGLVACHNRHPKHVDLAQRHLCTFLTQYAVNKYLSGQHREDLAAYATVSALERDLKTELLVNKDIYTALETFAPQIMSMTGADGLLIKHDKGQNTWGILPDPERIKEIDHFLLKHTSEHSFATHKFIYNNHNETAGPGFFPGVIRVNLLPDSEYYLYLFRKEYMREEVWAGKPEKIMQYDADKNITFASPRNSFNAWKQIIKGKAEPWKKNEIAFVERIAYITQQAVARRSAEIQALNKELIRSNNALDTFGYTLNHDLKNPLAAIRLAAQVIQKKDNIPPEYLRKLSTNIIDASELIMDMVEKVHQLSKSTSVAFDRELINPRKKIISIIETCKIQFNVKHLDFVLGQTYPVKGERTLLYQLFLNLIGNAIKYSSQEKEPLVEVFSTQFGQRVSYFIKDNGIGMDLTTAGNIYDIFKRLPNASTFEGSGIGLSIVKRITDRLGAIISVESAVGRGTTFRIDFDNDSNIQI